ncbi:hypothetical protein AVEN_126996-1 [Araneus ventricosus]|uniref:Uncharacterized protein n=1 Tax=Araneus ventricosus TaxID=182803 RepID=A0A4Y2C087_ARAVE|nr:hypothetical protein AVEN_126996-1 [Araneus ventricosus]
MPFGCRNGFRYGGMGQCSVWFAIEISVEYGLKHIFKIVQYTTHLSDDMKWIIYPVIEIKAFFCHPENMFLDMVVDQRQNIRESGYRRILKARTQNQKVKTARTFKTPSINLDVTDYSELIDWTKCRLSSPPMMEGLTTQSISSVFQNKSLPVFDFLNFPCLTQTVERCVKLVTESPEKV